MTAPPRIPALTHSFATPPPPPPPSANHTHPIVPPSFSHGPAVASLIREKRRQLSLANQSTPTTTATSSPLSSPIERNIPLPAAAASQDQRRPRSRGQTRIGALADMTIRFDSLKPLTLISSPAASDPSLAEVVMTPTTEEWWAFGGLSHKSSKCSSKASLRESASSATSIAPTKTSNRGREQEEEEDEEDDQADDDSDYTGASSNDSERCPRSSDTHSPKPEPSSSVTTPDNSPEACINDHPLQSPTSNHPTTTTSQLVPPLNICPAIIPSPTPNSPTNLISPLSSPLEFSAGLISCSEAEPSLPIPTLTSVNGIFNVPSSPLTDTLQIHKSEPHHAFPTLTAMSSYSVGSPTESSALEPLTSTALLSSLLDKAPPTASRPCSLVHDGIVRKTIDPRSYSAITGHRNLDSFVIHSSAGSGAYGIVKHAQEKGADGQPVGPPLVIKYIIKQRILADCWKRHKVLGPVPIEIHVLDHLRRVNYRTSIISMATQYMEARNSKGDSTPVETIPNRTDLIQLCAHENASGGTLHQRTGHPNICGILDYFEDSDYYYLVMPRFGDGKDLFEHIELAPDGLPTPEVRRIFGQIVDGVAFLHERNIVHRDLKDENVILDRDGNAQLIDFGSAAYVREGSKFETFSGTLDFAAPEVLKGVPHGGKEIDIWALGVILFVLITGECPFWNPEEAAKGIGEGSRARAKLETHLATKRHALNGEERRAFDGDDESESVLDLLKHCLHLDAASRPSIEHICWHKFFLPSFGWSGPSIPSIAEPSLPPPAV
ncbi:hypothetical protein PtA15_3A17 [Puccinia triticina]|uniref:Protein kinase domain-containing protein n=1 Tax=Puccinia triticina TaxID=208348 RepID=A0ABY7CC87_9BASI|nr:uncharacterized protein PtA15_3A17 [Puccinia triticina]WAQ82654.1 hypothetical protein PtA15_3A17 [Puccinia triticina]